jgi:lipoprotein-anchoring transpeptidase ErfK/SrfK
MRRAPVFVLALVLGVTSFSSCRFEPQDDEPPTERVATRAETEPRGASPLGSLERRATDEDVDRARRDTTWRQYRPRGPAARRAAQTPLSNAEIVQYVRALHLPLSGDTDDRAVFYVQVLLDRAVFSPGQIDGRWGQNTEKAIHWLQYREGIQPTGAVDRTTLERLLRLADAPRTPEDLIVTHRLTEEDVAGPFNPIPEDIYEQAEMDRLGYETLGEKLGEKFNISPNMLSELNDGIDLSRLAAGDSLRAPAVRTGTPPARGSIQRLVVSDGGRYLHALDANGTVTYHFPASLGDQYQPSPRETLEIESVTKDPYWHYQPAILADVDDDDEDALIPPGPNNAVGLVWINLSKQHFGIHGTNAPGTIGYATSAGCVRLTNWDVLFLADRVGEGMTVEFTDLEGGGTRRTSS